MLPLIHRQLAAQLPLLLRHWRLFLGLALTQSVLGQGLLFVSLHTTTAINVGLLQTLQPVFILFLVALLFGERIGLRQAIGTAAALLGVVVTIARGDLDVLLGLGFVPGDILILIGTASWSVYAILVKRAPALNPLVLFFGITAVGGALLLPLYLAETLLLGRAMPLSWSAAGAVGYVATINGIAALTLVNIGIIHLGPSRAGVFYYPHPGVRRGAGHPAARRIVPGVPRRGHGPGAARRLSRRPRRDALMPRAPAAAADARP